MFAGHLAAGLALKQVGRQLNLGWLFFAALFHDLLLGILVLAGLEQIHVPADFAQAHYLTFTFPYSHGLAASAAWSLLAFGIAWAALPRWTHAERRQAGLAAALAVFSHFVLDWLVHVPDLPLLGNDSLKLGLGLWDSPLFALALETALVLAAFLFYMVKTRPGSNLKRWGLGLLMLLVTALTVAGTLFAETPPPASGAAMTWIFEPFLICGVAYWLDKKA